jgi:hypothetical protein
MIASHPGPQKRGAGGTQLGVGKAVTVFPVSTR